MNSKALAKGIAKISLIVFALALVGFFVFNFVLPVLAPEGEEKQIYFVVKDSSGIAVANAKVEMFVSDSLDEEYVSETSSLTASDGTAVISTSSVDKYAYFVVSKLGYENGWPDSGEPSMSAERYVINVSDITSSAENPITVILDVIPAIWTDKSEYRPEETVYIYGSAFDYPTVHLTIKVRDNVVDEQDVNVVDGDKILSLLVKVDESGSTYRHRDFYSEEQSETSQDPYLEVCYPSVCGNGILEGNEQCEKVGNQWPLCCNSTTCQFKSAGTLCRAADGICDIEEYCTGSSADCPQDQVRPDTYECRAKYGPCDVAEYCDGVNKYCPSDSFEPNGTLCRQGGVCDPAEYCTGNSAACPPDEKSPLSTPCEADGLFCTVEHCNGNGSCVYWKPYDCSDYNLPEIAQCDYNPDNYFPTFDYAEGVLGICNETTDRCEYGQYSFTHTCADSDLTDNGPVIPVGNGIRNCSAECDGYGDECLPKLENDYCYYGGICNTNPNSCLCNYTNNEFCPPAGTIYDGNCYWGTRECTENGCGLTITPMGCKNYCNATSGPQDTIGPDIKDIVFVPNPAGGENCLVNITATTIENCTNITYAEYFFDKQCTGTGIPIYPADDGSFDNDKQVEYLQAIGVDVSGLSDGAHSLYLRAKNSDGYWGPCVGILIEIDKYPPVVKNMTIENASWVDSNGYWICANNGNLTSWICDEPAQSRICNAEFIVDSHPVPGKGYPLYPLDGTWNDSVCEHVYGIIQNNDYSEGRHWVKVRGHDCACHWGKVLEINPIWFIIDRSYPTTTKTVGEPKVSCGDNCYYITKNTPITLNCQDPDNGNGYYSDDVTIYWRYQLNNNGTWFEFSHHSSQVTFYYPEDSNHTLEYWCVDECGNEEPHHFEIDIVDTKPPIVEKIITGPKEDAPAPYHLYIRSSSNITLNCTDQEPHQVGEELLHWEMYWKNETGDEWQLIGSGTEQGYKKFTGLNDSYHKLVYWCEDALGNTETNQTELDIVDNKKPISNKTLGNPKRACTQEEYQLYCNDFQPIDGCYFITSSTPITISCEDPQPHPSGVFSIRYAYYPFGQWWNYTLVNYKNSTTFYIPNESVHVLRWYCVDRVGNIENTTHPYRDHVECDIVDNTPPVSNKTITGSNRKCTPEEQALYYPSLPDPTDGCYFINSSTTITINCSDQLPHPVNNVKIYYRNYLVGETPPEFTVVNDDNVTITKTPDSAHILEWYCEDELGNTEDLHTEYDIVDNTPPATIKTIGDPKYQCTEEICDWYVTQNTEINLSCSDQLPHPVDQVKIYYKIDWKENWNDPWQEGNWIEDSDFVSIKYNNDSFHRLTWYCLDALGNKEQTQTEIDIIDTQPPVSTKTLGDPKHACEEGEQALYYLGLPNPSDGCYFITQQTQINLTCADLGNHPVNHVKIYYKDWIVGEEEPGWTIVNDDYVTIYKTEESAHILKWYCEDELGNTEDLHTEYDIVDNTPPQGTKSVGEPKLPCEVQESEGTLQCLWVSNLTTITLNCVDFQPHPVDHEKMCYRVSFDDSWLTQQYCYQFGGHMEGDWCCVDKCNLPYNITFMEDSLHDLEYYCEDALGNKNQVDVEYFKVDSTPPTTTKTYGQPLVESAAAAYPKWINSSTPITLTAEDGGEICAVGVDKIYWRNTIVSNDSCYDVNICLQQTGRGDFKEYTGPIYKAEESCHLIEYYSVDELGNTEPVKKQCVFVDNTPPATIKTIGDPKYQCTEEICDWYVTQNTEINLSCSDQLPHPVDQVKIYYKIDWKENWNDPWQEGNWIEDSDFVSIKYNNDSFHRLTWYCLDALGNKEQTQTEIDIVDTVPPTISKIIIGPKFFNETEDKLYIDGSTIIHVESTDPEPHPVDQVTCDWDYTVTDGQKQGQGGVGIIPPFNITFPEESTHVLTIICKDALGNTVTDVETFLVDKTSPNTTKSYGQPYFTYEGKKWVNSSTPITLTVEDTGPHKSGIKETKYRVTLVSDNYCLSQLSCEEATGSGTWLTYTQPFTISQESCHLIEFYSVDNVEKTEQMKRQCVYVDNKAPEIVKIVGKPRTEWDGKDANFYDIADKCWNKSSPNYIECWKVTLFTPIILDCVDPEPHPVNHEEVCFKVEWDGEDKTQYYCDLASGSYNKYGDGFCCGLNAPYEFRFNEETEHNLKYYCLDALGNKGEKIDEEKFKVEGTTFEIQLNKKWNLISVPFVMLDDSIDEVFKDIEDKIESVWTYDAETNQWYVYVPGVGGTLTEMVPGWGYWVKAKSVVNLTIGGSLFSPAKTPPERKVVHGWNLIGYFGTENQTGYYGPRGNGKSAYCALYSLIDTVVGHPRWSSLVTYWEPDNPYQWKYLGLYSNMDPGAGYWLEMDVNDTYTYSTVCGYWWI